MNGLYILDKAFFSRIYGERDRKEIETLLTVVHPPMTTEQVRDNPEVLKDIDIIISGWGAPLLDQRFLDNAPRLKAIFYGAGSIRNIVTDAFWKRDIIITSSWAANALPVAEFTEAAVVLSLKHAWGLSAMTKRERTFMIPDEGNIPGLYGAKVGVVSLGKIGRLVCLRLLSHDLELFAYDPYTSPEYAHQMGVQLSGLEEVFETCDVVSLHTPLLKETCGMIRGTHLESMKPNATFINTARGALVNEKEMIEVLRKRPDLRAVLDVTDPEPPQTDSALYELPNVTLTPHIAGSHGAECRRMGRYAIEELKRYLNGQPLKWRITKEAFQSMA
ncbi:MAG: glycerate dehydrogenase [Chitinivibrionales bacterium]|nr:glycerate dehydrogenase [Chitinivibrionales bacterium]MBD3357670.1 glycerate dehydrogenase [Chitinivibrionales bacterium]